MQISDDNGSNWSNIANSTVWTYNRTTGAGVSTGAVDLPLDLTAGDLIRVQMACTTSTNVESDPTACNLTVFTVGSVSGPKGEKGDTGATGAPGDIIWTGPYDSSRTYQIHEAVEYLGTSYVSTANDNTETPSDTASNWDIVAKKGSAGSGSNINVADEGSNIPNTPHDTLNFIGDSVEATDGGNGTANITVDPKYESFSYIWAEENAALNANAYEWAFGNGANTPANHGVSVYIPNGYKAEIVALGLNISSDNADVKATVQCEVGDDSGNVDIIGSVTVDQTTATTNRTVTELSTPYELTNADVINFKTVDVSGSTRAPNVVTAIIKYKKL
jgi:hypothetical protein